MSNVYVITDTHFGHPNIAKYCNRPDGWEELVLENIDKIPKNSLLVHLGDFALKNKEEWIKRYFAVAPRENALIIGNHDKKSKHWYATHGFDWVDNTMFYLTDNMVGVLFSHKPYCGKTGFDINIHGHFHNAPKERWEPNLRVCAERPNHRLLILEETYAPVKLEELI